MARKQMYDSMMQVVSKCLDTNLLQRPLSDFTQTFRNDMAEVQTGLFWIIHDDAGVAYGVIYEKDKLTIYGISDLIIRAVVERRDVNVYSFPKNTINVSRVKLIDIFKKCEDSYKQDIWERTIKY